MISNTPYPSSPNETSPAPQPGPNEPARQPIHAPIPEEPAHEPLPDQPLGQPGDANVPRVFKPWFDVQIGAELAASVPVPPPPFPTPAPDPKDAAESPKTPHRPVP